MLDSFLCDNFKMLFIAKVTLMVQVCRENSQLSIKREGGKFLLIPQAFCDSKDVTVMALWV